MATSTGGVSAGGLLGGGRRAVGVSPAYSRVKPREIVVLYNSSSGRGKGPGLAEAFRSVLVGDGHKVVAGEARETNGALRGMLTRADLLVLVGGDGTLHHALPALSETRTPVYHVPLGNENLAPREFGMDSRPATLRQAIESWRVREVDLGECNGRLFAVMASVGPDASIVHAIARHRRGQISHVSYVPWILRESVQPHLPRLRVKVDGESLVDGEPGLLLVANSRQYALRIDPACAASVMDGKLDVVFMRARSSLRFAGWMLQARLRRAGRDPKHTHALAERVEVESLDEPARCQIDGEAPGVRLGMRRGDPVPDGGMTPLEMRVRGRALKVLSPS